MKKKQTSRQGKEFGGLELTSGLLGALPIPIIGEIAGTYFFYKTLDGFPITDTKFKRLGMAIGITGLMRLGCYEGFPGYKQAYNFLLNLASR